MRILTEVGEGRFELWRWYNCCCTLYVKLVSIPTDKAASPAKFFARAGFEQEKVKVAINVLAFGKFQVHTLALRPARLTKVFVIPISKVPDSKSN
jgi:hypothetical protein